MRLHVLTTATTLPALAGLSACHQASSFCRHQQVAVPPEAALHSATLATGSFLSLLYGTWPQASSADSQREKQHPKCSEWGLWRPGRRWPLSQVDTLQRGWMEQLSQQERPSPAYTRRKGSSPPVLLPGTLAHQNAESQVPSLGGHLLSTRCSHIPQLPSAKVFVFISKPAFCPNRTHCFWMSWPWPKRWFCMIPHWMHRAVTFQALFVPRAPLAFSRGSQVSESMVAKLCACVFINHNDVVLNPSPQVLQIPYWLFSTPMLPDTFSSINKFG